jgi:hypothetical protein
VGTTHTAIEAFGEEERPVTAPARPGGVTWRAAVISLAIILLSVPAIFYGEVVWASRYAGDVAKTGIWSTDAPAAWPLTILFLGAALMSLPVLRRIGLTRRELLTVHTAVLVATPLLGSGVLFFVLSIVVGYYYFGHAFTTWETFLPLIPAWFAPSSESAVDGYFVGGTAVPWAEWARPLAAWSSFMICLFGARFCLLALVQQQWIRNERLTFPLAEVPLQMVEQKGEGEAGRLTRNKLFWIGLVAAFLLSFLSNLSRWVPAMPSVPSSLIVMQQQDVGPLVGVGRLEILLVPWLIALAYIVPKEISFSVWFFWLAKLAAAAVAISFGADPMPADSWWAHTFPAPFDQVTGAVLVLSAWVLWRARKHLARALRIAVTRQGQDSDADEPLSYRWAVIGLLVCLVWMVLFLVLAGCRPVFGLFYVAVIVGLGFSYARICSETAFDPTTGFAQDIVTTPTGRRGLLPREIIAVFTMGWTYTPFPSQVISVCSMNALTSFKIGDAAGIPLRRLTRLLFGGFLVALGVGAVYMLHALYGIGFSATQAGSGDVFPGWYFRWSGNEILDSLTTGEGLVGETGSASTQWAAMAWWGLGAASVVFIAWMRLRFLWWPFHPVGYVLGLSVLADDGPGQSPFLVAWMVKSLVLRYGGLRLYRETLPIAVGLIVGDVLNRSVWNVIFLVAHGHL